MNYFNFVRWVGFMLCVATALVIPSSCDYQCLRHALSSSRGLASVPWSALLLLVGEFFRTHRPLLLLVIAVIVLFLRRRLLLLMFIAVIVQVV